MVLTSTAAAGRIAGWSWTRIACSGVAVGETDMAFTPAAAAARAWRGRGPVDTAR
jgi:hypothetical protein